MTGTVRVCAASESVLRDCVNLNVNPTHFKFTVVRRPSHSANDVRIYTVNTTQLASRAMMATMLAKLTPAFFLAHNTGPSESLTQATLITIHDRYLTVCRRAI